MRKNNTEFLKECMADSLIELMKSKPFDKITITEITDKAGVGRATWFRNFSSKNDALTYKLVTMWYIWTNTNDSNKAKRYTIENALDFFEFSYSIRELYNLIYSYNLQTVIYDAFYQIVIPQHRDNPVDCYKSRFISHGLFGLLDEWIKRDYKETPAEMSKLFHQNLQHAGNI